MIKVTIFNEHIQDQFGEKEFDFMKEWPLDEEAKQRMVAEGAEIRALHEGYIHDTIRRIVEEDVDIKVCHYADNEQEENGLTEEVLLDTDVLIWWAHLGHEGVSDEVAFRVVKHVHNGMGFICLHSGHMAKPFRYLLGSTGTLRWREGDKCRLWNTCPTHPIAKGIPEYVELEKEEMYGEYFDVAKPDDVVFTGWFAGGEVFRSGCTWTRGYGRIFYFQPGHETNPSYMVPEIRQIIRNAVHWVSETNVPRKEKMECFAVKDPMEFGKPVEELKMF